MHPRYRLYLVPKGWDDLYVVGATQIESNDNGPMTVRSALELLSAAYSLHTGFAEARIVDVRTNCRPALNDNLPRIQQQGLDFESERFISSWFLISASDWLSKRSVPRWYSLMPITVSLNLK